MSDKSEAAMENGVKNSAKVGSHARMSVRMYAWHSRTQVLVIMSESYFERPFCLKELRWAQQYNKPVVVGIEPLLRPRIGEMLAKCPSDLRSIGSIDFKVLDRSDVEFFELGIKKLLDPAAARCIEVRLFGVHFERNEQ